MFKRISSGIKSLYSVAEEFVENAVAYYYLRKCCKTVSECGQIVDRINGRLAEATEYFTQVTAELEQNRKQRDARWAEEDRVEAREKSQRTAQDLGELIKNSSLGHRNKRYLN